MPVDWKLAITYQIYCLDDALAFMGNDIALKGINRLLGPGKPPEVGTVPQHWDLLLFRPLPLTTEVVTSFGVT